MATPVSIQEVGYTGFSTTIGDTINVNYSLAYDIPDFSTLTVYEAGDLATSLTYTIISLGIIQITQNGTTPAAGTFVLKLDVPTDSFVRSIVNGNIFKEQTLKDLFTQLMIISGSVAEGRLAAFNQDLDMNNHFITNLTDGVNPQDAATIAQLTPLLTAIVDAAASAAAALISENAAAASEAATTLSEANAALSEAAAASSAAEGLYNAVTSKVFGDSPVVPLLAEEGTLYRIDTSGGNVVINLSDLATYAEDMKFAFVKITPDVNTVTINRGGTDTIQGGVSVVLDVQYEVNVLVGDSATGTWLNVIQSSIIADGAVTLAKLALGVAGNLISYDAAGNPVAVNTGTVGQLLLSNGVGVSPSMQDAPSTLVNKVRGVYFNEDKPIISTTSTTYLKITGDVVITPQDVDSKFLVLVFGECGMTWGSGTFDGDFKITRDAVTIEETLRSGRRTVAGTHGFHLSMGAQDAPATVSSITFAAWTRVGGGAGTIDLAGSNGHRYIQVIEYI